MANAELGNSPGAVLAELPFSSVGSVLSLTKLVRTIADPDSHWIMTRLSDYREEMEAWVCSPEVVEALVKGIDLVAPCDVQKIDNALFVLGVV